MRGGPADVTAPRPPGIWAIDAAAGGTVCVLDPAQVSVWRAETAQAQTVLLAGPAARGEVAYAAGQPVAPWPAALPVADGTAFKVGGFAKPVTLTVRILPTRPATIEDLAAALIAQGCSGQIERVARLTAVPG